MNKNDFIRGVEAAVNAQKGFNEKQARATEEIAKRVVKKIDDLGNVVDVVIDQLNAQEKERLYSLKEQFDPKDLDDTEKELVVSLIYTLSMQYEQNSQQQMDYYYNIKKYLGVANPSGDCDLSCVENIENVSDSKGIHAIISEFLFLKNGNHSYREEFEDFLDNFYVKAKDIKQVEEQINTRYEIMGAEDIVRHFDFGYDTFAEFENNNDSTSVDEETGVSYKNLENIKDNSEKLNSLNLRELQLERSYVSPQEIVRKKVLISGVSSISSNITFKECIFVSENEKPAKIILAGCSEVEFIDCCFDWEGLSIISDNVAEKLEFIKCTFKNCDKFIVNLDVHSLRISECYFFNIGRFLGLNYDEFDHNKKADCLFDNNVVIVDNKRLHSIENEWPDDGIHNNVFYFNHKNSIVLCNNLFVGYNDLDRDRGSGINIVSATGIMEMRDCTFYNLLDCVEGSYHDEDCTILNCEFIECYGSPLGGFTSCAIVKESANINDCIFRECEGLMIGTFFDINIRNCTFLSCMGEAIQADTGCTISNCEFKHIKVTDDCLIRTKSNPYHHDMHSTVEYCTFDDIELENEYIAECGTSKKRSSPALFIKDCTFSNIHTKRSDQEIILTEYEVGRFSSSTTTNVEILRCTGTNNVDSGTLSQDKPAYSKKRANGSIIGAMSGENYGRDIVNSIFN